MSDARRKFAPMLALILPVAILKGAALMLGSSGPASAGAGGAHDLPPAVPSRNRPDPTESEVTALMHLRALATSAFGEVPLYYESHPLQDTSDDPDPVPIPVMVSPIKGVLRAVMETSSGTTALIGDELYTVGDRLVTDDQWVVTEIDSNIGMARVQHDTTDVERQLWLRPPDDDDAAPGPPVP